MAAIAASRAADAYYDALPDFEFSDPERHNAEQDRLLAAWNTACEAEPANWAEFVALFDCMTDNGNSVLHEDHGALLHQHARRLVGS